MKQLYRCQSLNADGKQCREKANKSFQYHGENELYYGLDGEHGPTWVKVYLCKKHYLR